MSVRSEFGALLDELGGTKESINKAKDWMLARPQHVHELAVALREHVERSDFSKILYAIYLLNDVFFNSSNDDPFRSGFFGQLARIVQCASSAAPDQASRDKICKVMDLWGSRNVFDADAVNTLRAATRNDLATMPVGVMAGILKVALANGHEPWKPLDVVDLPALVPPPVEPARLDARIKDFYRVLDADRAKRVEKRAARERHFDDRVFLVDDTVEPPPPPPKRPAHSAAVSDVRTPDPARPIGDDNVGKQMLRGMGWEEGTGLGVAGRGRADPVNDAGQTDKVGIGVKQDEPDIFAQYRSQRGHSYRARWASHAADTR